MALPATVGSGLSWSDHLSGRHGPFQRPIAQYGFSGITEVSVGNAASTARIGQTFTPGFSGNASGVTLLLKQVGANRSYTCELYATASGIPTGAALASTAFNSSSVGTTLRLLRIDFSPAVALTSGTMYAVVVRPTANDLDATNNLTWMQAESANYAGGTRVSFNSTTPAWSTVAQDMIFTIHEENGPLYVVALDKTNNTVEVWKSTDSGQTWAEVDAANHKTITSTATFKSMDAVLVGTAITVAYITGASTNSFCDFDTATDTWGTAVASTHGVTHVVDNTGSAPIFVARRHNGDTIICREAAFTNMTVQRGPYYDRYVSAVWTNSTAVHAGAQINYEARPIATDGAIIVFPFVDVANDDIFLRALSSADALGTQFTVTVTGNATATYLQYGTIYDGSEFNSAQQGNTAAGLNYNRVTVSGNTITSVAVASAISASTVTNPELLTHAATLVNIAGTIHAFWINDNQTDIDRDNDAGTNTWSVDVAWKTGLGTLTSITAQPVSIGGSSVGVLYLEAGTIKYDSYPQSTLSTPSFPPPRRAPNHLLVR